MVCDEEKNISVGALVRLRVRNAPPYLGIVVERVWQNNNNKLGYFIYLMELEISIMMFDNEFEVLNDKNA